MFRIKREHSGVEHDTIGFKDQPRKIRKLAEVFLLRSIPANREPELFLKRYFLGDSEWRRVSRTTVLGLVCVTNWRRRWIVEGER